MMGFFVFTMIFSAPLIPTYLNVRNLRLIDTMWAVILPNPELIEEMANASVAQSQRLAMVEVLKYAVIVFCSLPVIMLSPFVQKHFVKGVIAGMISSEYAMTNGVTMMVTPFC